MNTELDHIQPIISAVYENKKFVERLIGVTEYKWEFQKVSYQGTCRMPVPFNDFDAVICGVLASKPLNFTDLGHAIGLMVDDNRAADCLLKQAVDELKKRNIIVEKEQTYTLTEEGLDCLTRQQKPERVKRQFNLIYNAIGKQIKNAHKIFENLPFEYNYSYGRSTVEINDLDIIKECAVEQVPDVHCPEKNIVLKDAVKQSVTTYTTELIVAVLHNCRDNSLRALVFEHANNQPIAALSDALSDDRQELKLVVDKIVKNKENEQDADQFYLKYNEGYWDERDFKKTDQQQQIENELIASQQQYEEAVKRHHTKIAAQIRETELQNKIYFDAIEFENELLRLLDTTNGDIWLISPWLKKAARRLIPHIKKYLDRGGKVFIFYSKSEYYNNTQMADEEVLESFKQLDNQYSNFYISQSDSPFHDKHLFLRNVEKPAHFMGSYNILSFNAAQSDSYTVRQETMVKLDWTEETERTFYQYHNNFARVYKGKAEEELCPIAEKIYISARDAYNSYGNKLNYGRHHFYYDDYRNCFTYNPRYESFPYKDYSYIFEDFEKTPKAFISDSERKELINKLQKIKLDYLEPFSHIKTKYLSEKNVPLYENCKNFYQYVDECTSLIDLHHKFIKLLRDMNKI